MDKSIKRPWIRILSGSLLVALIAMFHINFLTLGNGTWWGFLVSLIFMIYLSWKKVQKESIKHFQCKTASILSFLLPISAIIYSIAFTETMVAKTNSGAAQTGTAIGGFIGGGIVTVFAFIIGISLGIVFHLLSKKSHK